MGFEIGHNINKIPYLDINIIFYNSIHTPAPCFYKVNLSRSLIQSHALKVMVGGGVEAALNLNRQ
jgi:hypothetical protein